MTSCPGVCTDIASDVENCGSCGKVCLPPPKNGSAICEGAAGCSVHCDPNHIRCGNLCCDMAPENAFAACTGTTTCTMQCNATFHACNGAVSPCYADTDTAHCGLSCLDCRQPNATPVCDGTQCSNICTGTTLACGGTGGKVSCGTWDFESMTVEAWTNSSSTWGQDASGGALEVSSAHASSGSYSLAIPHSNPTGTFAVSAIKVHLCPNGSPLDLRTRSLWVHVLFEPAVGGSLDSSDSDFQYAMWNGANNLGIYSLDNNMPLTPGQWLVRTSMPLVPPPATGMETVTDIEIEFDTFNSPWVGTIYLDEIRIQ